MDMAEKEYDTGIKKFVIYGGGDLSHLVDMAIRKWVKRMLGDPLRKDSQ